ncbi:TIGR00730 family Rossman fold protein [Xanthovirga aplysinae]|uniref:LOG family protein n=1 Tax=Xanthovirga aplysinae TaxID=2529853 RepID=UPI0012BB7A96|nr:TIGR00730 family Rossman fold protein [Xanthovirga aplysinae]
MIQNVGVFCASSTKVDPIYFETADKLGRLFAENNIQLIYGGGAKGLMGQIGDSVMNSGGKAIGIIPEFMIQVEWQHKGLTEIIITQDMRERKSLIMEKSNALVALPGGCGTLEELFEALTLKRLGQFVHPIVIVNVKGYYDPLIEMLNRSIEENFMHKNHQNLWVEVSSAEEVLEAVQNAPLWDESAIKFAGV